MNISEKDREIVAVKWRDASLEAIKHGRILSANEEMDIIIAAIPERPQIEPPADIVERAEAVYMKSTALTYRERLAEVIRDALNDPRVLGDITETQWDAVVMKVQGGLRIANRILEYRRNALLAPAKKTPKERYEVRAVDEMAWAVFFDGIEVPCTETQDNNIAKATRRGLIAELEEREAKHD